MNHGPFSRSTERGARPPVARVRFIALARAACLTLSTVLAAGHARANSGVRATPWDMPGNRSGAFLPRPTVLVVEHEELGFQCDAVDCKFEAVYHIQNPSDTREQVLGAFYGVDTHAFAANADGVDARYRLTPEQLKAIDEAVTAPACQINPDQRKVCEQPPPLGPTDLVTREGFFLTVDAHASATLVFSGRSRDIWWASTGTIKRLRQVTA